MGKSQISCDNVILKKGLWTPEEDQKLLAYILKQGHGNWVSLLAKAGLQRCGKSCRMRWINYLRPDIKRGKFSLEEEQTIIQLHALLGNRWSVIASQLPKRTDNEIKNYWNAHVKKRLIKMGIDPVTHEPQRNAHLSSGQLKKAAHLSHMAQWEKARLQAECRLVRHVPTPPLSITSSSTAVNNVAPPLPPPPPPPCLDVLTALRVPRGSFETPVAVGSTFRIIPTTQPAENTGGAGVEGIKYWTASSDERSMAYSAESTAWVGELPTFREDYLSFDVSDSHDDVDGSSQKCCGPTMQRLFGRQR